MWTISAINSRTRGLERWKAFIGPTAALVGFCPVVYNLHRRRQLGRWLRPLVNYSTWETATPSACARQLPFEGHADSTLPPSAAGYTFFLNAKAWNAPTQGPFALAVAS